MASIRKQFEVSAPAARVWDAFKDVDSARSERLAHHNASFRVFATGPASCRIVRIADLLPDAAASPIGAMMDAGVAAMKKRLAEP